MRKQSPVSCYLSLDKSFKLTHRADVPEVESPALTTALKAFATLTREQKAALSRTLDGFVDCLASATNPNPAAKMVISENGWHNRANWNEVEWATWVTWGWYRHFCRLVSFIVCICAAGAGY